MKASEQYFLVALVLLQNEVVITFKSDDKALVYHHSIEGTKNHYHFKVNCGAFSGL